MEKIDYNEFLDYLKELYDTKDFRVTYEDGSLTAQVKKDLSKEYAELKGLKVEEIRDEINKIVEYIAKIIVHRISGKDPAVSLIDALNEEDAKDFIEKVESYFLSKEDISNLIFKASAKGRIFKELDWEINSKEFEKDLHEKISDIKIARFKLNLIGNGEKSISFETDKEGVGELLKQLNSVYDRMEN